MTENLDPKPGRVQMREAYARAAEALLRRDPRIVLGEADLGRAVFGDGYRPLRERFPRQTFDVGIAESDLVGVGCGLAAAGMIPVLHTFAPFLTRRAFDTVFVSAAYAGLPVKLMGSDPGVTAAHNGGTHMAFEDMAVMRCVPEATVLEFTDNVMLEKLLPRIVYREGLVYCRILRALCPEPVYPPDAEFTIGRAVRLREGDDLTLIASGILVAEALKAAELLQTEGIRARVVDMFTWKPLDREEMLAAARETGAIVTAENHNVIGGLYSAVTECLAGRWLAPVAACGAGDTFGMVGELPELKDRFGMTARALVQKAKEVLEWKKQGRGISWKSGSWS